MLNAFIFCYFLTFSSSCIVRRWYCDVNDGYRFVFLSIKRKSGQLKSKRFVSIVDKATSTSVFIKISGIASDSVFDKGEN